MVGHFSGRNWRSPKILQARLLNGSCIKTMKTDNNSKVKDGKKHSESGSEVFSKSKVTIRFLGKSRSRNSITSARATNGTEFCQRPWEKLFRKL